MFKATSNPKRAEPNSSSSKRYQAAARCRLGFAYGFWCSCYINRADALGRICLTCEAALHCLMGKAGTKVS